MEQKLYEKLINDGILKKHNLKAYLKVIKEFEKSNIVGIVHATGTGKSFIALQLMYDNNGKKILYIVPRSGIRNQIEEHINSLSSNARDEYFSGLTIYTFHKLINMSREEIANLDVDYLIVDEFHHLSKDASAWMNAVKLIIETHPNIKIFGMTATPVRNRGTYKQENVADTFFKGHIASTYTLAEAFADGVLMPPIYKGAIYKISEKINNTEIKIRNSSLDNDRKSKYLKMIDEAKKRVVGADSFEKIIRKNLKPNGKYAIFCPRGKREELQNESMTWFKDFIDEKNIRRYFVDSKYPKESDINLDAFYNDNDDSKLRLMFSMDMFTEGIHVPGIDGIIMMRPTMSEIMFVQMVGRGTRNDIQTLILDFVNNYEYILKLKDYTAKEVVKREKSGDYSSIDGLKKMLDSFDIELIDLDILNMLDDIDKKVDLSLEQKIVEFIELLNNGYIPKARDFVTKFSNGDSINYFWNSNKEKIIKKISESKYDLGYEKAKETIKNDDIDKISEYIELLNTGYSPIPIDSNTFFSNGDAVNQFWHNHKDQIIELLNDDMYNDGYDVARESVNQNVFDKYADFIELVNNGYVPIYIDKKTCFSNGEPINYFWGNNHDKVIAYFLNNPKYKIGYEVAHNTLCNKIDKIAEIIELLNSGYIPRANDTNTFFSNGEAINQFWTNHKKQIIDRLFSSPQYNEGYDNAFGVLDSLAFDRVTDYIEILNNGYIPKKYDPVGTFSNGDIINYFWGAHKKEVFEKLDNDDKYNEGYELAKEIAKMMRIKNKKEQREYKEMLIESHPKQFIKK